MEAKKANGWTGAGKAGAVLRLLKGEDAAVVAREACVPLDEILGWRDVFLRGGTEALSRGGVGGSLETTDGGALDDDWAPLDWQLDGDRLGRMALALGELISQQQKLRDR